MMDPQWLKQQRQEAARWAQKLLSREFVIFDGETTGLEIWDEFVQLGVIDHNGEVLLDTLVKPVQAISSGAAKVHGLSAVHLVGAPGFPEVYPALSEALAERTVIVYNVDFDRRILMQTCKRYDLSMIKAATWDCAMKQYAQYHGAWNNTRYSFRWHSLTDACAKEQIQSLNAHSAVGDCRMTLRLIQKMAAGVEG
jgi:DNA polymerase III subunit epsilon